MRMFVDRDAPATSREEKDTAPAGGSRGVSDIFV